MSKTTNDAIIAAAREAVETWTNWVVADGWANDEYDVFAAAMNDLERLLTEPEE